MTVRQREASPVRVLIVGGSSYIGSSFQAYLAPFPERYRVIPMASRGLVPVPEMFSGVDAVLFAAGIAHIRETSKNRPLYDAVNRELAVRTAECAKEAGVRQFLLLSSMSVYGLTEGVITPHTVPAPATAYGISKLAADEAVSAMAGGGFRPCVIRPPMVYGRGCKGNYPRLRKLALTSPVFPACVNRRSMIYIGNLCEFLKRVLDDDLSGTYFPQDAEYVCTADMVLRIAACAGKKPLLVPAPAALGRLPVSAARKVFGSLVYEKRDTVDRYSFAEAIRLSEGVGE